MAIQGTQVPMYTKHTLFLYFSDFQFLFRKKKQSNKNRKTKWKHERKMQMHESMIPKADKKSSKESPTLDRNN